jgi:hypothetical protein
MGCAKGMSLHAVGGYINIVVCDKVSSFFNYLLFTEKKLKLETIQLSSK